VRDIAIAIVCKTPAAGQSKTRLCPPLSPAEGAALSACFIRDISTTVDELVRDGNVTGYAVYTPAGTEAQLRPLLPATFQLLPQCEGDLGIRLIAATRTLLTRHAGVILVNGDSPTLPASILRAAVDGTQRGDLALGPALDGGYTLIGLSEAHERLFADIPWSTPEVYRRTVERAQEIGVPVTSVPGWYDIDDAASLALLQAEFAGEPLPFGLVGSGAAAPATRSYLARHEGLARRAE
jgi:hypothetical protein